MGDAFRGVFSVVLSVAHVDAMDNNVCNEPRITVIGVDDVSIGIDVDNTSDRTHCPQ